MTNGPNNLFDDIVVPIGISTIVTKKPSLNQILVEELIKVIYEQYYKKPWVENEESPA